MGASGNQEARARRETRERARALRRQLTPAEALLWTRLRGRRFLDWKFVRQAPIGPYIADFLCRSALVVVEVDGATHSTEAEVAHDARRTAFLVGQGYRVVRVGNIDARDNPEGVEETILAALEKRLVGVPRRLRGAALIRPSGTFSRDAGEGMRGGRRDFAAA